MNAHTLFLTIPLLVIGPLMGQTPAIDVTPTTLSAALYTGGQDTQVVQIGNTGASDLIYSITVEYEGAQAASLEFLGNVDYPQDVSDVWGYSAPDGTELAIMGTYSGTAFIDVSTNPSQPVEVAFISGPSSSWRDIKTYSNYAYIVTDGGGGLQIVDLADPMNPVLASTYTASFNYAHNLFIDEAGFAYIVGSDAAYGGLHILDLTDPVAPVVAGNWSDRYVHDVYVRDDTAYAACIWDGLLEIIDVTNKSNPTRFAGMATSGLFTHNVWLTDDGDYALTTDEVFGGYVDIYDISDFTNITMVAQYRVDPTHIPHNLFVKGNLAYLSAYVDGVVVLDISDPTAPVLVGQYDTYDGLETGYAGAWGVYPFAGRNFIYVSDIQTGLYVLEAHGWLGTSPDAGTVAAGSSVDVNATFDAAGLSGGSHAANMVISSNDPVDPEVIVAVSLAVTDAPNIAVSADTLDFGPVFIGFPDTLAVMVKNTGFASLQITGISVVAAGFTASTNTFTLDIEESRLIDVTFEATAVQTYSGSLIITSNDPDNPMVTVVLQGQGLEPPDIAVSPDSLSDSLLTGALSENYLTIENTGSSDLVWAISLEDLGLGTVTITKEDYADWTLSRNQDRITDNVWLARANTQGLFNAATESGYSYGSPNDTEWSFGYTEELGPEDYQTWVNAINSYPPGMVNNPLSLHLITDDIYFDVMFHTWTSAGQGGGFSYTRTDVRPVWLSVTPDSGIVAAGASQTVAMNIDAIGLDAGSHDAFIVVSSNDPDEGAVSIPIHLDVTGASDIYTAVDTIDFGQVFVNYADSVELLVENKGTEDLLINPIVADPAEYTISPTFAGINPDDSQVFLVKFAPMAVNDYPGTITFTTTDPDEGTYVITLLGEGLEPPIVGVAPDSLWADLMTNDSVQQVLTILNTGASDLVYAIRTLNAAFDTTPAPGAPAVAHVTSAQGAPRSLKEALRIPDPILRSWNQEKKAYGSITKLAGAGGADNVVWQHLYTDGDEPEMDPDVHNVYGGQTTEHWQLKIDLHGQFTYPEAYFVSAMDIDQDTATGLNIDQAGYGWGLGIDQIVVVFFMEEIALGALGQYVELPGDDWDWEFLDTLITGSLDMVNNEIIISVPSHHHEELAVINMALEVALDGFDQVPDIGLGHFIFPLSPPWVRLSASGGVIPAGSQEDITVTFDAESMFGGDYLAHIQVMSNDPVTPLLAVPTLLSVTGIPIYAGPDTADFGISYIGYLDSLYLRIDNIGTDVLEIGSLVSGDGQLTFSPSSLSIPPLSGDTLVLYLLTGTGGVFATTLSFTTNNDSTPLVTLPVLSTVLVAPVIGMAPAALAFTDSIDGIISDTLIIGNSGGSDLAWEIAIEQVGGTSITFTKPDYADLTNPANWDQISEAVAITRANTQGIFNILAEGYYIRDSSPGDTWWSFGHTSELQEWDYEVWFYAVAGNPPSMVDQPMSMFIISENKYYDILFHSWTSGGNGGGFSYTRTDAAPGWIDVSQGSGTTAAGSITSLTVTVNYGRLEPGDYQAEIVLASNDPARPETVVPVAFTVLPKQDPGEMADHNNGVIATTVFNNGAVGIIRGEIGVGFDYKGLNGLYDGTLIIGQSKDSVSGRLYKSPEFVAHGPIEASESPFLTMTQSWKAIFDDSGAANMLGLLVIQSSYASESTGPDEDYIIMDYRIVNQSGSDLDGIHVALAMDWDVGSYGANWGSYDSDRQLSYIYEDTGQNNPYYYGIAALSGAVSGHTVRYVGQQDDAVDDSIYYHHMTHFDSDPGVPGDLRAIIATGPLHIPVNDTVRVGFAILGGDDLADLRLNADRAHGNWDALLALDAGSAGIPAEFALHQNYPNPFNPTATIRFDLPQSAQVSLVVYDLLGRRVAELVSQEIEPGYHSVTWNARGITGRNLASGIYIARLHATPTAGVTPGYTKSIKMVLLK